MSAHRKQVPDRKPRPDRKTTWDRALARALGSLALIPIGCRPEGLPRSVSPVDSDAALAAARRISSYGPSFLARLEFPTANSARAKPTGLLAGDLDGDGKDEIVAATRSPGGIEIWKGLSPVLGPAPEPRAFPFGDYPIGPVWLGGGPPARSSERLTAGKNTRSLAAIASRETLELQVIDLAATLRSKEGAEPAVVWRTKLPARPRAIASGDLARDGKPEVAVITIEDELLLYSGPGNPVRIPLAHEHAIPPAHEHGVCALLASDGERIAIGFQASRKIAILRADGTAEKSAELPGLPRALAEADVDGDGDSELLVAAGDDRLVVFGLGRPGGCATWLDEAQVDTPRRRRSAFEAEVGRVPIAIAPADFGGREGVVVLALHDQEVRILGFAGDTAAQLAVRAAGQRPFDLAIGDFDGDGTRDLAVANTDARRVGVLFGAGGKTPGGATFASETRTACDRSPASIAAGDVDGDGDADLAVLAAADETLSVLRNERGELVRSEPGLSAPGADAAACADLDGDEKSEIAWLRGGTRGSTIVVQGRDSNVFPIFHSTGATSLLFADLNGDGKPDAVIADAGRDFAAVLENKSESSIVLGVAHPTPVPSGPRAAVALRSPGAQVRIAIAAGGPGRSRGIDLSSAGQDAYGSPVLLDPVLLPMTQHPIALSAGDLDGDGREDLAVLATESGGDSQGLVIPWIGKADGSWRALDPMPTGARPQKIAAGDLDGDGKAEILVTVQGSHHVEVWLARAGDPVRFARGPDLAAGTGPLDILLVDLDGDGRKEIVVANGFSDDVSVIRVK